MAVDAQAPTVAERFIAGGLAGAVSQIAIYPLEVRTLIPDCDIPHPLGVRALHTP